MNNIIKVEVCKTYVFKDLLGRKVHLQQVDPPWNDLVKLIEVGVKPTGVQAEYVIVAGLSASQSISEILGSILTVQKDADREMREIAIISGTPNLIGRLLKPVTT
jgi:hypothetical protein